MVNEEIESFIEGYILECHKEEFVRANILQAQVLSGEVI